MPHICHFGLSGKGCPDFRIEFGSLEHLAVFWDLDSPLELLYLFFCQRCGHNLIHLGCNFVSNWRSIFFHIKFILFKNVHDLIIVYVLLFKLKK